MTQIKTKTNSNIKTTRENTWNFNDNKNTKLQSTSSKSNHTNKNHPYSNHEIHHSYAITKPISYSSLTSPSPPVCPLCRQGHRLYFCADFLSLPINTRFDKAQELHLCLNCLRSNHTASECTHSHYQKCATKHNMMLHPENEPPSTTTSPSNDTALQCYKFQLTSSKRVLLSTALVTMILG